MKEILSRRIAQGERITELSICRQFNVSQAPVREAIRDLELLGFVVSSPFRGAIVREFSLADLVQIYQIRAVLEGLAARVAATRMTQAQLRRLEALIVAMRRALLHHDTHAAVAANAQFHALIVEASGNAQLEQIWQRMQLATTINASVHAKKQGAVQSMAERHVPILDALRAGDAALAEQVMREHIEEALQALYLREAEEQARLAAAEREAERTRGRKGARGSTRRGGKKPVSRRARRDEVA
jgi:DNA-binding GntR family transcriptional regulator